MKQRLRKSVLGSGVKFLFSMEDGEDMLVCEVCGLEEEIENGDEQVIQSAILHICENCRNDRKINADESS